jgi:hypothetical protein
MEERFGSRAHLEKEVGSASSCRKVVSLRVGLCGPSCLDGLSSTSAVTARSSYQGNSILQRLLNNPGIVIRT